MKAYVPRIKSSTKSKDQKGYLKETCLPTFNTLNLCQKPAMITCMQLHSLCPWHFGTKYPKQDSVLLSTSLGCHHFGIKTMSKISTSQAKGENSVIQCGQGVPRNHKCHGFSVDFGANLNQVIAWTVLRTIPFFTCTFRTFRRRELGWRIASFGSLECRLLVVISLKDKPTNFQQKQSKNQTDVAQTAKPKQYNYNIFHIIYPFIPRNDALYF